MSPIRVAIVGLGKDISPTMQGSWAIIAHLPYLTASPLYEIVAVCNSSVASAEASIASNKLGPNVKAYGSVEDLAKDPNVDLAVVTVHVAKHYQLAKPLISGGKDIFVEWPLGFTSKEANELTELAKSKGVKTIAGAQSYADPVVRKAQEIIASGAIGDVVYSAVQGVFTFGNGDIHEAMLKYFEYDKSLGTGGSVYTIIIGHFVAAFTKVLGPFEKLTSYVRTQFPTANVVDGTGKVVQENFKKETPDHILVEGTLRSGALASLQFRGSTKTIHGHGITWTIAGSKGEIEIRGEQPGVWQMQSTPTLKLLKDSEGEVEVVDYKIATQPSVFENIPGPALNTGRVYEAFATGDTESYATFEDALALHYLLEKIIQTSK